MLKYLIAVTGHLVTVSVLMALFTSRLNRENIKKNKLITLSIFIVGLIASFILFLIKYSDPKGTNIALIKLNRLLILGVFIFALISLISWFIKKRKLIHLLFFAITIALSLTYELRQVIQYTQEFVYFGESGISTMALLRAIGFTLALILCYLIYLSVIYILKDLNKRSYNIFYLFVFVFYLVDYFLKAVTAVARMKWINISGIVFKIMILADKYSEAGIFLMVPLLIITSIYVIVTNKKVIGKFANKALRRKEKARLRRNRRWSYSVLIFATTALLIVTVVNYYENKEVELAEPQEYKIEENMIVIPLTDFADGKLHRYSYVTPNGYNVRFIGVKKPGVNAYGLGLDACEICGIAGYFERGDDIVCKRCDVVMNKATIGFKGGCNPIPFPYVIENEKIYIKLEDLEREEKRFR